IYWAGIGRVVYGLSEAGLLELTGNQPGNATLMHPCRSVFADGRRETVVAGPLMKMRLLLHTVISGCNRDCATPRADIRAGAHHQRHDRAPSRSEMRL